MTATVALAYLLPLTLVTVVYVFFRRRSERRSLATIAEYEEAGLSEPASLHPIIDPARCLGCGACVRACPEGAVLGLVADKAQLIAGANCIGHGACRAACPFDAIELVFGTASRGVDIPEVAPDFQTNVPGLFIAGELGGMGLIRNAVTQGVQSVDGIIQAARERRHPELDLVIVGAGPAGLAAALAARKAGLRFIVLEQETLGGTVAHFPRGKIVMTAPVDLPLVGRMHFREVKKEALLDFWHRSLAGVELPLLSQVRVDRVVPSANAFDVETTAGVYQAGCVLLAIGRRGTPRKLGVPGEELSKVVYRMIDPEQYAGRRVIIVGGGDSALEAAAEIADQPGTAVTLSYRKSGFSRAKPKNRQRVEDGISSGRIDMRFNSSISSIEPDRVVIETSGEPEALENDDVIVCAGGILPTAFLRESGIHIETKYGTA